MENEKQETLITKKYDITTKDGWRRLFDDAVLEAFSDFEKENQSIQAKHLDEKLQIKIPAQ